MDCYVTVCYDEGHKIRRVLDWNKKIESKAGYIILRLRERESKRLLGQIILKEENDMCPHVYYFIVDPQLRGLGLGSYLLTVAESFAIDLGYNIIKLNAQKEFLEKLIPFYLDNGYKRVSKVSFEKKLI